MELTHKQRIGEAQEIIDSLYIILFKLDRLEFFEDVKNVKELIDRLLLFQIRVQDERNERI
jgi:hypothetical protein